MNADSHFSIGKTHDVCQDYARSGVTPEGVAFPGRKYAIVSDGCSGSPDTDFGARFLTMVAAECLGLYGVPKDEWIIWRTRDRVTLPLSTNCLDATLLMAFENKDMVSIWVAGDGVVAFKYRNGKIVTFDIEFQGAPAYLSYLLDPARFINYVNEGFGLGRLWHYDDGEMVEQYGYQVSPEEHGDMLLELGTGSDFGEIESVMVFSDGVHSFYSKSGPVPMLEVVRCLSDIKTYTGEFIKRRVKFFEAKECPKLGWSHSDDLSMAAIHIPESEKAHE